MIFNSLPVLVAWISCPPADTRRLSSGMTTLKAREKKMREKKTRVGPRLAPRMMLMRRKIRFKESTWPRALRRGTLDRRELAFSDHSELFSIYRWSIAKRG